MTSPERTTGSLKRVLRSGDVILLGIGSVIGSGIFLLPGIVAEMMGPAAILSFIGAAFLCLLIALCFAEVGGRYEQTGGAYLYAREVFGGFAGFSVGWMGWWVRLISWAALANGFAIAVLSLFDHTPTFLDEVVAVLVILVLAAVNFRGAKLGAVVMNVLTVAKLLPLAVFVVVGLFFVDLDRLTPFAPHGYRSFADSTLVILWAFVGFEVLSIPAGEMRNPSRAVPLAFVTVMGVVTVIYLGVFLVASGTYDGLAGSANPVAEAAGTFLGSAGGIFVAIGVAVSILGGNSVSAIVAPRALYALAEQGQMPKSLGRVHAEYRTPAVAIVVSTVLTVLLAVSGSFEQLAVISVVARFFQYIPTCLAVMVLRHRDRKNGAVASGFRAPFGPIVPVLATLCCIGLLIQAEPDRLLAGAAAFASVSRSTWRFVATVADGGRMPRRSSRKWLPLLRKLRGITDRTASHILNRLLKISNRAKAQENRREQEKRTRTVSFYRADLPRSGARAADSYVLCFSRSRDVRVVHRCFGQHGLEFGSRRCLGSRTGRGRELYRCARSSAVVLRGGVQRWAYRVLGDSGAGYCDRDRGRSVLGARSASFRAELCTGRSHRRVADRRTDQFGSLRYPRERRGSVMRGDERGVGRYRICQFRGDPDSRVLHRHWRLGRLVHGTDRSPDRRDLPRRSFRARRIPTRGCQ